MPAGESRTAEGREAQRAAYGEPLAEIFGRLREAFGLNQSALAGVLGISAPMLSQLNSAQRVKIGNPAVLQRVQALDELVGQLGSGEVTPEQVPAKLEEIKASTGRLTRSTTAFVPVEAEDGAVVAGMRNLLRAVASSRSILDWLRCCASTAPAPWSRPASTTSGIRTSSEPRTARPVPEVTRCRLPVLTSGHEAGPLRPIEFSMHSAMV